MAGNHPVQIPPVRTLQRKPRSAACLADVAVIDPAAISILGDFTGCLDVVLREPLRDVTIMAIADHIVADVSSKEGWSSAIGLEASLGTLKSSCMFAVDKILRNSQGNGFQCKNPYNRKFTIHQRNKSHISYVLRKLKSPSARTPRSVGALDAWVTAMREERRHQDFTQGFLNR